MIFFYIPVSPTKSSKQFYIIGTKKVIRLESYGQIIDDLFLKNKNL